MQEPYQTGTAEPQGGDEGTWVTVAEFSRIKRGVVSKRTIYKYIKKGIFKSKKISGTKTCMLVKDAHDAEKILYLRALNKDKELMAKKNRHRIEFDIPLVDLGLFLLFAPIVTDHLLIAEKCSNISIAHKQEIEIDGNVYSKLKGTAKQFGMTVPVLTQHIIYQIITEKLQQL